MNRFLLILLLSFPIFGEEINDPFEDLNRDIFIFNEKLDEKLLKPAALTYRKVTPQFARTGVTNFFNNLEEIDTTINQVLQGEIKYAFNDAGRFVINSTIGLFGLIDVASKMGLEKHEEDFGQTLGVWGFDSGPYIMIPFLGPSNPRDLLSRPISSFLSGTFAMEDNDVKITLVGIDALETRERLLDAETLIIGDKYIFVKDAYIQSREYEINNGSTEDDEFLDDMDDIFGDD
jgi:phospholipid-binding lipoprotein MlaA